MPTITETLVANTVTRVPLDAPTGKVVITMLSGPGTLWATSDGTDPVVPAASEVTGSQQVLAGVVGAQLPLTPSVAGYPMVAPSIRLISAGTPVVEITW